MSDVIFTPTTVSVLLYVMLTSVVFIEYYLTVSNHKVSSQSGQSYHRNELDDSLSRARNISVVTRISKRDSSPLDVSERNAQNPPPAKSAAEENRIRFYKYLSVSLFLRLAFLPFERQYSSNVDDKTAMTVSSSLPSLSWMISFTLLTCFYAEVTFMALVKPNQMRVLNSFRKLFVPIVYCIYGTIIFFNRVMPIITDTWFETLVWGMLSLYNAILFLSMSYFGLSIAIILKSSLNGGLGLRLVSTSLVCSVTFALRSALDGLEVFNALNNTEVSLVPFQINQPKWNNAFGQAILEYIALELIPTIVVLILMHKSNENDTNKKNLNAAPSRQKATANDETETALGVESSEVLPPTALDLHGQVFLESKTKQGTLFAKRSNTSNVGVPISMTNRSILSQQQGPRVISASYGMMRTTPSIKGERASLVEKSNSAVASSNYGSTQNEV